jgi:hypothetical protein
MVVMLPRASPLPKVAFRGVIMVTNTANGAVLGYISKTSLNGQYGYRPLIEDALIVSYRLDVGATMADNVRIHSEVSASWLKCAPTSPLRQNSDNNGRFPLLALVQGRDDASADLGPGSF